MTTQQTTRLSVNAEVINLQCGCGGDCINAAGSKRIERMNEQVTCEKCGAFYVVPAHYFQHIYANTVLDPREQRLENNFHLMIRQWDRSPKGHGSREEQTVSWAWILYSKHGCSASGVCATMKEQSYQLDAAGNTDLAVMYRQFVRDVEQEEE